MTTMDEAAASRRDRAADIADLVAEDRRQARGHPTRLGLDRHLLILIPDETGRVTDQHPEEAP